LELIRAIQESNHLAAERAQQKIFLAQSNAVIWLQSQATNGDAGSQFDLAEHYLNGQGCETNHAKAIYWLTQSANQGNTEASNKLVNLK
jgi:TPR repeat protein